VPGGWKVHDYLEHNKSREQIQDTSKRRGDGGKLGGRPPNKTSHETVEGNLQGFHGGNHTGNPASSFPASSGTAPSSREDARPPARRAPLHDTTHKSHAHCGRICLHSSLFGEFVRRRGHADADREVRDWALQVDREWSDGGAKAHLEPGDSFDFWRARYAERWPVAVQAQSTLRPSTAGTLAAAAEIMRGES
jgi:hypothetical protein